jgi:hypothetical protein
MHRSDKTLFDHLVGSAEQKRRFVDAEYLGALGLTTSSVCCKTGIADFPSKC